MKRVVSTFVRQSRSITLVGLVGLSGLGCESAPTEPQPEPRQEPQIRQVDRSATKTLTVAANPNDKGDSADPAGGKFTLAQATEGLPGSGKLVATLVTDAGKLECKLYDDKAPITVANFVGLARGLRPFKEPGGNWVKRPAYDGTTFHRIIKGFMIQGGDPMGTGAGEPGYVIDDEVWDGATHDRRGLLCMANRGPNTNGMQFFIMDGAAKHLDSGYTIFGECTPDTVIEKLANTPVRGDRAITPPKISEVTVRRGT